MNRTDLHPANSSNLVGDIIYLMHLVFAMAGLPNLFVCEIVISFVTNIKIFSSTFGPFPQCRGQTETTVGEEKQFNPRLSKDIDTFVNIMENLNLAYPKMIGEWSMEDIIDLQQKCVYFGQIGFTVFKV